MDFKKITILIFAFYFLALLETSFLVHFNIFLAKHLIWNPSFILIAVILFNFCENPKNFLGIFGAICGGFFWDIFSTGPVGFHILTLTILAFLIKVTLKRYVRYPSFRRL